MNLQDNKAICCGTCDFYYTDGDTDADGAEYGECMRFPPVFCGLPELEPEQNKPFAWKQPSVYPNWTKCGEWLAQGSKTHNGGGQRRDD